MVWMKKNSFFEKFSLRDFSYKSIYDSSFALLAKDLAIRNEKEIKDLGLVFTSSLTGNGHLVKAKEKKFRNGIILGRVKQHKRICLMLIGENIYVLCARSFLRQISGNKNRVIFNAWKDCKYHL